MKALILVLVALAVGCSSRKPSRIVLHPQSEPTHVRLPEVIGAYHLGRQVDARNHLHEAHPLYRVEVEARWDLRPGGSQGPVLSQQGRLDPSDLPAPVNDAITAEFHRQKDYTERVLQEATQLAKSHTQIQELITLMARVAREHEAFGATLGTLETRQKSIEEEMKRLTATPAP